MPCLVGCLLVGHLNPSQWTVGGSWGLAQLWGQFGISPRCWPVIGRLAEGCLENVI